MRLVLACLLVSLGACTSRDASTNLPSPPPIPQPILLWAGCLDLMNDCINPWGGLAKSVPPMSCVPKVHTCAPGEDKGADPSCCPSACVAEAQRLALLGDDDSAFNEVFVHQYHTCFPGPFPAKGEPYGR